MDSPARSDHSASVRSYYENNTRLFLKLSGSGTQTIHRPVWGEGVNNLREAFAYTNRLLLEEIESLPAADPPVKLQVLDLGCGVGSSLFYLASRATRPFAGVGVTISPLQVELARRQADRLGLAERCAFVEADFLSLPALPLADLIFSIEAFVLSANPSRFMEEAGRALKSGGRLAICDDFLTETGASPALSAEQNDWLGRFQHGWRAAGLASLAQARVFARDAGLRLVADRNLTPWLRLNGWRNRLLAVGVIVGRRLGLRGDYWDSLVGGDALRRCLQAGLIEYHFAVFEKD
jgi:SAM-dependent methyltransferase